MPRGYPVGKKQLGVFLERIAAGDTITRAAQAAGQETPSAFYTRADRKSLNYDEAFAQGFAEAMQERALIRADKVDVKFDDWIEAEECPAPIKLAWARRWNPAYRDQQRVEITGVGGGAVEVSVKHDPTQLRAMLEEVGLVRRVDSEAVDGAEPAGLLPARTD